MADSDEPCAVLPRRGGHRYVQAERVALGGASACPLLITYVTVTPRRPCRSKKSVAKLPGTADRTRSERSRNAFRASAFGTFLERPLCLGRGAVAVAELAGLESGAAVRGDGAHANRRALARHYGALLRQNLCSVTRYISRAV